MKYLLINIILLHFLLGQEIFSEFLIEGTDTTDVFSYQIPGEYESSTSHSLIVTFHQWGGNENSNYNTSFDEEANLRNWVLLSPFGGSANNYNHQGMQDIVEKELIWMMENYNIDKNKIYMVGGSMGGATGAIYANNHLNPKKPMVAATASASGILDCERRAIEMDGNNSMTEWFGGNWDEVPFEYHRNSAVYFADHTQSMHYNLKYTPLYLDFGVTEPHRTHAEELHELILEYNNDMWIDTEPTGSHGYSVFDENHVCNWLSQFELIDNPDTINVNLDEPSRAYWLEAYNQLSVDEFIRINARRFYGDISHGLTSWEGYSFFINEYSNADSLVLHALDQEYLIDNNITLYINGNLTNIGFTGPIFNGSNINDINAFIVEDDSYCQNFNFNIDDNHIIWVEKYDNYEGICQSYTPYKINFNFSPLEQNIDINQDGIWNVLDIVLVMNHVLGLDFLSDIQIMNADLNNDLIINVLDVVLIVNLILEN